MKKFIFIGVLFAAFILANSALYVVTEDKQVIITEFGAPVGEPVTKAGLHFKKPFFQEPRFVDKRIMSWDGFPNQIPTKDKKYIMVDTTARWRVIDPLKFIQTVRDEKGAKARLDTILDSTTRDVISKQNLVEAVRNSNKILEKIDELRAQDGILEEEVTGEIEKIEIGREKLSQEIIETADKELTQFGIKLVDVQLRRISYEKSVEEKVFERMISERQRVAQKIRSIGQGEKAKIEGRISKDLETIRSEAYRKSQGVRGEGEAKASAIYAKTMGKDARFFEFIRSIEAYEKSLGEDTRLILSSDSEFLKILE